MYKKRVDKLRHSLKEIGVSILSGAVTTILSGMVLYFCSTTLFKKFSVIICATIFLSIFIALFFFSSLCYLIGPSGHFGDLRYYVWDPFKRLIKKLYLKIREKQKECSVKPKDDDVDESKPENDSDKKPPVESE